MEMERVIGIIKRKSSIPLENESFAEIEEAYIIAEDVLKKELLKNTNGDLKNRLTQAIYDYGISDTTWFNVAEDMASYLMEVIDELGEKLK